MPYGSPVVLVISKGAGAVQESLRWYPEVKLNNLPAGRALPSGGITYKKISACEAGRQKISHWGGQNLPSCGGCTATWGEGAHAAEGQQSEMTGTLNSDSQLALVARAGAGHTAGQNLSPLGNETAKLCDVLVIDGLDLINAETANLFAAFTSAGQRSGLSFLSAMTKASFSHK